MLVVLDPELFRAGGAGDAPLDDAEDASLRARLLAANATIRALEGVGRPEVVASAGSAELWYKLHRERIRGLARRVRRETSAEIDRLVDRGRRGRVLPAANGHARYYFVRPMFDEGAAPGGWLPIMEQVLAACALAGEPTYAVVARAEGRNVKNHSADGVALMEVTRWRLYVQVRGAAQLDVPCVSRARHVQVPWTARFDAGLPDARHDGARCPFCPPAHWWKRGTPAWRTYQSRPCWIDAHGNAWARPRTGGEYHWDVYLADPKRVEAIGLDQLNVTGAGAPASEGRAGSLHHVPEDKRAALRIPNPRWAC